MNSVSSRSHAIFTVMLRQTITEPDGVRMHLGMSFWPRWIDPCHAYLDGDDLTKRWLAVFAGALEEAFYAPTSLFESHRNAALCHGLYDACPDLDEQLRVELDGVSREAALRAAEAASEASRKEPDAAKAASGVRVSGKNRVKHDAGAMFVLEGGKRWTERGRDEGSVRWHKPAFVLIW